MEMTFSIIGAFTGVAGLVYAALAHRIAKKSLNIGKRDSVFNRQLDFAQNILDVVGNVPSAISVWYTACHFEKDGSTIGQKRNQFHKLITDTMGIQIKGALFIPNSIKPSIDEFVKTLTSVHNAGLHISEDQINIITEACKSLEKELNEKLKLDDLKK